MRRLYKALLLRWANGTNVLAYTNKIIALGPIAYFPMAEAAGATVMLDASGNARNGAYKAAGEPVLGVVGIGDGRTSAQYDGTNDFANAYTAGMAGAFNGAEGTILIWAAGTASAGTAQRMISLQVDGNNLVRIRWNATNGAMTFDYIAGGTAKQVVANALMAAGAAYACYALTWSASGDAAKAYKNGVQQGSTQTGLGTFAGSLGATLCCIGAADTSSGSPFIGSQAHAAIFSSALSAAQLLTIAAP